MQKTSKSVLTINKESKSILKYFPLIVSVSTFQNSKLSEKPQTSIFDINSDFASTAKDSSRREQITYICGLRARIECEPLSEHSTRSDRVTNIGYLLSLGASTLPAANQNLIQ